MNGMQRAMARRTSRPGQLRSRRHRGAQKKVSEKSICTCKRRVFLTMRRGIRPVPSAGRDERALPTQGVARQLAGD